MSIEDTIRQIVREENNILKEELVSVLKLNQRNTAEELPYLLTIEESSKFMRVSKSVM